jgi:histone H3
LDILRHDGNTLGVDGTQVGIFEKTNQVSFGGFLEGQDGRSLESEITLEILGDLTDQTLERKLSDEKVGTLLVATDLTEGDSSGSVSVGLLDSSGGRSRLSGSLGGKLLAGSFSSGGLAGGLLGSGHFD